jgi:two-component system, LytTR family, response regulator
MMRIVIADDEVLARQKLRQLLHGEPDVEIVGECATACETIELVRAAKPDLLFLDIRMPDMDGFDVLGALTNGQLELLPQIIFTTAYDQYAVRAFEYNAADYLLKPFTQDRLCTSVQRVRARIADADQGTNGRVADVAGGNYKNRIVFKSRGRIVFLPVEDIRWIGAEENYVRISTGNESHLLRETMARLETTLDPEVFLRVHRSSIVNLHYVKEVKSDTDGESMVVLTGGEKIAMSRGYRMRIQKLLHR